MTGSQDRKENFKRTGKQHNSVTPTLKRHNIDNQGAASAKDESQNKDTWHHFDLFHVTENIGCRPALERKTRRTIKPPGSKD